MSGDAGPANGRALYFAYGSNLDARRIRERVSSARRVCTAWASGRRLIFGKRGRDGSGKATLVSDPEARVWGVLYAMVTAHWELLDRFEPGYARVAIAVTTERGESVDATTYVAPQTLDDPVAFAWYKRLVVEAARDQGLPAHYVASLERLPERPDESRVS